MKYLHKYCTSAIETAFDPNFVVDAKFQKVVLEIYQI